MNMEKLERQYLAYTKFLAENGSANIEIMTGAHTPLDYIKTGAVDMAGPLWPHKDDTDLMIGGYGENRIIGATDNNAEISDMRTMHLGLDFFAPSEAPVFSPFDGIIHSFKDNANLRDYGPTIIIEHNINEELTFFTLYGHLSKRSIASLKKGDKVKKGTQIATLGSREENGGWPPHLHFQIILDMLGKAGDFDGLCRPDESNYWLKLCPNPIGLLGLEVANYER